MTYDINLCKSENGKPIQSPCAINGMSYGTRFIPFVETNKYIDAEGFVSPAEVKKRAIRLHDELRQWALPKAMVIPEMDLGNGKKLKSYVRQIGSDSEGIYYDKMTGEDRDRFSATIRLLMCYITASSLGYGLMFS
jgi:hypothetical protein